MSDRVCWWVAGAMVLVAVVGSLALYPHLPARIPTHWNIHGEVDGTGAKEWAAFLLPAIMAGMIAFFALLPTLSPKPFTVDGFRSTYLFVMVLIVALMGFLHGLSLLAGLNEKMNTTRAMLVGLFLFFAAMGNVLGKLQRNFYVGIRVPWTLASDRVWNDTHRLAARLWVACGLIGLVLVLLGVPTAIPLLILGVAVVVPIGYSFVLSRRLERVDAPPSS